MKLRGNWKFDFSLLRRKTISWKRESIPFFLGKEDTKVTEKRGKIEKAGSEGGCASGRWVAWM